MLPDIYLYNNNKSKIVKIQDINNVLDNLYNLELRLPTFEELENLKKEPINTLKKIKKNISKIENKIPLYDPVSENIYLINKSNLYDRVIHQDYRFPDEDLIKEFEEKLNKLESEKSDDELIKRKIRKLKLNIMFMNYFDINTLYKTYIKVFYENTMITGDITVCKKKSFIPQFTYMNPFYTKKEVISMAINENIIKKFDMNLSKQKIMEICQKIKKHEISAIQLIEHQKYIISSGKVGLIQYYTIHGSSSINTYLRGFTDYNYQNEFLENIISSMWKLVISAPAFTKKCTLYRFIREDSFLNNLKIGDIFTEKGFLSSTRNPFYKLGDKDEEYSFGDILMKIHIPKNIKGVALCLETTSHFPEEQEVIFPPNAQFKLIKKDNNCIFSHPSKDKVEEISTKYEFEWVSNLKKIEFDKRNKPDIKICNFLKSFEITHDTLLNKIKNFINLYVNDMNQVIVNIGNKLFTTIAEFIDTSHAYKKFFQLEIKNNFCIYSIYEDYILFSIEIGEINGARLMCVNYYVKYNALDKGKIMSDDEFIQFISSVAYYFEINNVTIFADYKTCDIIKKSEINESTIRKNIYGGMYCIDINNYIETKHKKYEELKLLDIELSPEYSYEDIDALKNINPLKILSKTDSDELYQIYDKEYNGNKNIIDFYLWLLKNYCYLIENYIDKISRINKDNPFKYTYYKLNPLAYLYNKKIIESYPEFIQLNIIMKQNLIQTSYKDRRIVSALK
jgi:hypothetical protein